MIEAKFFYAWPTLFAFLYGLQMWLPFDMIDEKALVVGFISILFAERAILEENFNSKR